MNLPLVIEQNTVQRTVIVSRAEYPLYLPVPIFAPPKLITPGDSTKASHISIDFVHVSGPSFEDVALKHHATFVGSRLSFSPKDFKRTIAKIAFAAAVYAIGIEAIAHSPIRRCILTGEALSDFVGSWHGDPVNEGKGLHEIQIKAIGTEVHVILRLFAQFQTSEYHVIIGEANPDFVKSTEWPWT